MKNKLEKINEIIEMYYPVEKKGNLNFIKIYADPHDCFAIEDIKNAMETAEQGKNAKEAYSLFISSLELEVEQNITDFLLYELEHKLDIDFDEVQETFFEHYLFDIETEKMLKNTSFLPVIYFDENWGDLYIGIPLAKLVEQQGHEVEDVYNQKRNKSIFLKSVHEELFEYIIDLKGQQLIIAFKDIDFQKYFKMKYKEEKFFISKEATVGFYNRILGCGSGLNIKLEKDVDLSLLPEYELKLECQYLREYYSIFETYGTFPVYGGLVAEEKKVC